MKKTIFFLVATFLVATSFSQSEKYIAAMKKYRRYRQCIN